MSIYEMPKEELELLSYKDITAKLLEEKGAMKTTDLFKEIVKLLDLSEKAYESKIGDYYTSLTIDKRFLSLPNGTWDLRSRHTSDKVIVAIDEEDDELETLKEEPEDIINDDGEESYDDKDDSLELDNEDELKDLVILKEEELELEE